MNAVETFSSLHLFATGARAGVAHALTGVLNVVHGGRETVDFICDAPEIKAISFVGGNQVSQPASQSTYITAVRCLVISKVILILGYFAAAFPASRRRVFRGNERIPPFSSNIPFNTTSV